MAEETAGQAATRVQEAAANIHPTATPRERISGDRVGTSEAETVARRYFEAINAHDLEGAVALWAVGGRENVRGQVDVTAPEGVRAFVGDMLGAKPTCAGRSWTPSPRASAARCSGA